MAVFQTICAVLGRMVMMRTKIAAIQFSTDSFFIVGVFFSGFGLYHHFYVEAYKPFIVLIAALAGLCLVIAISLFHDAITYGKGGPAMALTQF
jgi:hypothetical protein